MLTSETNIMRSSAVGTTSDVSNFICLVLVQGFSSAICSNLSAVLRQPDLLVRDEGATTVATALTAVMRAVLSICTDTRIFDEQDLNEVLATVRKQFKLATECSEADQLVVVSCLEHVYQLVERNVRLAIEEASSGFPVSKGNFAMWQQARALPFVAVAR